MICEQVSDFDLIESYKQGDMDAGNHLYERYYNKVVQLCTRYLHSPEDGQDVAQEIFYKVIVDYKILKFRGDSKLWTWLSRVAINECNTYYRKRKAMQEISIIDEKGTEVIGEKIPANEPTVEEKILEQEQQSKLKEEIDQLPDRYSEALTYTYLDGYSYKETAGYLDISIQVLGVRLMRGKNMLLKSIKRSIPLNERSLSHTYQYSFA